MKVFIGWSGTKSHEVANALYGGLTSVINQAVPWISEYDIESGGPWARALADALEAAGVGIMCLTPENLDASWVLFEAGALSQQSRLCTYLFGVEAQDIKGPLAQFQACKADRSGTHRLLQTINRRATTPLPNEILNSAFAGWWPSLNNRLRQIKVPDIPWDLKRTIRGVPLREELSQVGIEDVENRDDFARELPPTDFYKREGQEVAISGVSLYQTFNKHVDVVHGLLRTGVKVHVMMLHPQSEDVRWISDREKREIEPDIKATIGAIRREGMYNDANFNIKVFLKLPPWIGVMIDGDISHVGDFPSDANGHIRVQPNTTYSTGHRGVILQFKKISGQPLSPFDYFAHDMRGYWRIGSLEPLELFTQ